MIKPYNFILHRPRAESECYEDKICLKTAANIQCRQVSFCLDEPSIELLELQGRLKMIKAELNKKGSIFNWTHFNGLNSMYYIMKVIGTVLLVAGLVITFISTCITCICRR